ncbi:MAG: NAAT family transporter [Acidobacteria bacterium]|nr:MAG: NAAT family transporter [Acidobacteriota bacterium]
MKIVSAAFLLFLVMDPVGNVPVFLTTLKQVEPRRRRKVVLRELLIALLVLVFFLFFGRSVLAALQVSQPALTIAGGIVLFLIAVRMIFSIGGEMFGGNPQGEPFIVPLAIPLVAGPSAITTVLLLNSRDPGLWADWLLALVLAWVASALILLAASSLAHYLGERVLMALERLMGMLLTIIAVEMFLSGVKRFWGG